MGKNKGWSYGCIIESDPHFDRVTASILMSAPDAPVHPSGSASNNNNPPSKEAKFLSTADEVAFLSYDNGDDDVRIHLHKVDNIPLPALLDAIEKGRKALLCEEE